MYDKMTTTTTTTTSHDSKLTPVGERGVGGPTTTTTVAAVTSCCERIAYPYLLHLARKLSRRHLLNTLMSDSSSLASSSVGGGDEGRAVGQSPTASASLPSSSLSEYWNTTDSDEFYVRYHVSRHTRQGQYEFLEYELLPNGQLRYANSSRSDDDDGGGMIRQEVYLSPGVVDEFKDIIRSSGIVHVDDSLWKVPTDHDDRQEIECKFDSVHMAFGTTEIRSVADITDSVDPDGLRTFYYLSLNLKALFHMLINAHFKPRPFG